MQWGLQRINGDTIIYTITMVVTPTKGRIYLQHFACMMTSSNGNIFRVTGHLCGEFTGHRWIPRTKASDKGCDVFFDLLPNERLSKPSWGWWFETPPRPLWRRSNVSYANVCIEFYTEWMGILAYILSRWLSRLAKVEFICNILRDKQRIRPTMHELFPQPLLNWNVETKKTINYTRCTLHTSIMKCLITWRVKFSRFTRMHLVQAMAVQWRCIFIRVWYRYIPQLLMWQSWANFITGYELVT